MVVQIKENGFKNIFSEYAYSPGGFVWSKTYSYKEHNTK